MESAALVFALAVLVALVVGIGLGFQLAKPRVENERKVAETKAAAFEKEIAAQKQELDVLRPKALELAAAQQKLKDEEGKYVQMKADLDAAFKGAAAEALRANTQSFLTLAKQELGGQTRQASQTLDAKEQAIKILVGPLEQALGRLDEQTRALESTRVGAYRELRALVERFSSDIPESLKSLNGETAQLVAALRAPKTRGDWGQEQLERCVEYAGMVEHCSFETQVRTRDEDGQLLLPDMTIQLPNGRTIVVDAKTPSDLFSDVKESADPEAMKARLTLHAARVKKHLNDLSSKAYWEQFEFSPEFVVCFLPSEALFSAALEGDPELIRYGSKLNVVMATPTTLIALLKAVNYGWQQSKIAESAKAIQETGRALYSKLVNAHEYFRNLGTSLSSAVGNYDKFVGAVEGRRGAFSYARRLGELVHDDEEIELLETISKEPRALVADDWAATPSLAFAAEAEGPDGADITSADLDHLPSHAN